MREHGSFAVPLMHCWSLPCVMVSDESRCIIDRLHIVLGPWLTIHYAACALNFNYANNLKRLDSYKKILSSTFSWLTRDHPSVSKVHSGDKWCCTSWFCLQQKITHFWLRSVIVSFDFGVDSDGALLPPVILLFSVPLTFHSFFLHLPEGYPFLWILTGCFSGMCVTANTSSAVKGKIFELSRETMACTCTFVVEESML